MEASQCLSGIRRYIATLFGGNGWRLVAHAAFHEFRVTGPHPLGSDWPMLSHERLLKEIPALELKDAVLEKFLKKNAEALLERVLG